MPARDIVDLLLTLGAVAPTTGDSNGTESVSLVQLIANPDKFDDKPVLVMGFLRLEYEGNAVYLHEEDFKHNLTNNALWVERNDIINENADSLNLHYVLIAGTFDASHKGHMGLFSGSLRDIKRAMVWPGR